MSQQGKFLTAEWRNLVMLNYEIEPSILLSRVPNGTELDTFNNKTFISVVGFMFLNTKVLGIPIPFHVNFEEVNLRFYVRRKDGDEWKRAVVFIKEIVPRWAIATVARVVYNEKYEAMKMRHKLEIENETLKPNSTLEYGWHYKNNWNTLNATITGEPKSLAKGSEEEFITEHYWGYSAQRDGGTMEYQVEHPPWNVWQVSEAKLDCDVENVYGKEFIETLNGKLSSAFVADGSKIIVRKGKKLVLSSEF
jgi:hypothetical protein